MLTPNQVKWIAALRGNEYKYLQDGYLRKGHAYGSLGIACELAILDGVMLEVVGVDGHVTYNDMIRLLPPDVCKWLGVSGTAVAFKTRVNGCYDLVEWIDTVRPSAEQVACLIESGVLLERTQS